jgi:Protein of unknown function (DUF4013)
MSYVDAFTDFFKSPKWMMNLLLGAVCFMIPVVGPLVYMGWLITGFWGREDRRPETFPDFDFSNFSTYLERGVWPFVVTLVVTFVMVVPATIISFMIMFGTVFGMAAGHEAGHAHNDAPPVWLGLGFVIMFGVMMCLQLVAGLVLVPLMLRAERSQDFRAALSFGWVKDFIARMWLDMLVSLLVLMVGGMLLGIIGYMMLCVGILFVVPIVQYAWFHMKAQLYDHYVTRGGQPVELGPKLREFASPLLPPPAA